jgi:Uma2 family endonuclease
MAATETRTYTPEDLLAMPEGKSFELVDGNLVERNMGAISSWVAGRIFARLEPFCEARNLGWAWPADNGYQCFPDDPRKVRRPDASFIRLGRMPVAQIPEGFIRIPPDLAIEVISPNDLAYEIDEKILEYLGVGVRLVWVINPETRTVMVYRADETVTRLREDQDLDGEDVVPGFRCPIRELFPPRPEPANRE